MQKETPTYDTYNPYSSSATRSMSSTSKYVDGAFDVHGVNELPEVKEGQEEQFPGAPRAAMSVYMTISGILGFREKSSLPCCENFEYE
jgi:hypothetical protein